MGRAWGEAATIRVFILTDIRLLQDGLVEALSHSGRLEVVGCARTPEEAVDAVTKLRLDVLIFDVTTSAGLVGISLLKEQVPELRVVAVAVPELEEDIIRCTEAGISGYVTREESLDRLVGVIESVTRDEMPCSPRIAGVLMRRLAALAASRDGEALAEPLTPRELQIVALIDQHLSNKEIARTLSIQLSTVKNHVHSILGKLGARRRAEAPVRAGRSLGARAQSSLRLSAAGRLGTQS